jgi:ABC-type polysaccharide/polyol phosphate transport system ATPase subunit
VQLSCDARAAFRHFDPPPRSTNVRVGTILMLKKVDHRGRRPRKGKQQSQPAVELVDVSKWQDIIARIDRRYVRNEALQMLIELSIAISSVRSIAKGKFLGKPLEPVLNRISVVIHRGSIVGVIDIGGCSRMALLSILANSEAPSRGQVRFFGNMSAFNHIGVITFDQMTCRDLLVRGARIAGIPRREIDMALEGVAEFSGLGDHFGAALRRVPKSTLIDLGISFLCCLDYDVLIVNEVMKPNAKRVARNWDKYLSSAPSRGKTVIMTGRNLREVLKRSTHLLLIENAELLDYGEKEDMLLLHNEFIERACNTPVTAQALDTLDDDEFDMEE